MGMNVGYLTASRSSKADECYTPFYAVEPIIKYIPKDKIVWLPFDKEWSAYNVRLKELGYKTICSHIDNGQDFFEYEPDNWDVIISNPPYSKKDDVIERCYKLGKPFALLMPIATLQGKRRYESFKKGLELLTFDARISFYTNENLLELANSNHFGSAYFCHNLLPEKLILEKLNKFDRKIGVKKC